LFVWVALSWSRRVDALGTLAVAGSDSVEPLVRPDHDVTLCGRPGLLGRALGARWEDLRVGAGEADLFHGIGEVEGVLCPEKRSSHMPRSSWEPLLYL